MKRFTQFIRSSVVAGLASTSLLVAGCGNQEFVKQNFLESAASPGFRYIPAKVDILIAIDDTGGATNAINIVAPKVSEFLGGLKAKHWDYHVAQIPISQQQLIRKVLVNPDYNQSILPDGTQSPNMGFGIVPAPFAVTSVSSFPLITATNSTGMGDRTYNFMRGALSDVYAGAGFETNFLRDDALLAVIVLTNGHDVTVDQNPYDGALCSMSSAPFCNQYPYAAGPYPVSIDEKAALRAHAQALLGFKGYEKSLLRFYPIASSRFAQAGTATSCLGGGAVTGLSYTDMIDKGELFGLKTDFCDSAALSNVMSSIDADLNTIRQAYVYTAIALEKEPVPSTIRVIRNGTVIPQDPANGWSYLGFRDNFPTIGAIQDPDGTIRDLTIPLARRSGFMIQLNGTARMAGDQVPEVLFERY